MATRKHHRLVRFVGRKVCALFAVAIALGVVAFFAELTLPYALTLFLNSIGFQADSISQLSHFLPRWGYRHSLLLLVVVATGRGACLFTLFFLQTYMGESLACRIRKRLLDVVYSRDAVSTGRAMTIFSESATHAGQVLNWIQHGIVAFLIALLLAVSLLKINSAMSLVLLLGSVFLFGALAFASRRIKKLGSRASYLWMEANNRMAASIKNLLLLRIYDMQRQEMRMGKAQTQRISDCLTEHAAISNAFQASAQILGICLILGVISWQRHRAVIAAPTLISFLYLSMRFFTYTAQSAQSLSQAMIWIPEFIDLSHWWAQYSHFGQKKTPNNASRRRTPSLGGPLGWRVERLGHVYFGDVRTLIDDLTFDIDPGSTLLITGPSGAGKTTLLNLLIGILPVQKGKIEILSPKGSFPIEAVQKSLLSAIGYVGPESFLVEGTILDNILYGLRGKPHNDDLVAAIDAADCSFIYDLPKGLMHSLSEQGGGLSAGQKQRLCFLRALLRRPTVLILDEPTSNVDFETERRFIESLKRLKGEITQIIITHRLDFLAIADQHLILDVKTKTQQAMIG